MSVYKIFIQWLVHESIGVTWDFYWNIFVSKETTLNLVHLSSVNRWSHTYLYPMYKDKYIEHIRNLKRYQEVTAWYDALHDFDVQTVNIDMIQMIFELKEYESEYCIEQCEKCKFYDHLEQYERHVCFYYHDVCRWCYSIECCLECGIVTGSCKFHKNIMSGINPHKVCKCTKERIISDSFFIRKVRRVVPELRKAGWVFIMHGSIPNLEIYPPGEYQEEFLSYEEELECFYFGE